MWKNTKKLVIKVIFLYLFFQKTKKNRNDEAIYGKDDDLLAAQLKTSQLKKEIKRMEKALRAAYDIDGIVKTENELKRWQKEADQLETEMVSLHKVKNANERAMKELDADATINKRFKKTKNSAVNIKNELKEKQELLREEEKAIKDEHAQIIEMEGKCRMLAQLMRDHNRATEPPAPAREIHDNEIDEANREIEILEKQLKEEENNYKKKLRKFKFKVDEADAENNILAVKLKEKDQEGRLNDLRIRELKRGVPHKTLKPLNSSRMPETSQKATTHYPSHLNTTRKPFNKAGLSKVSSQTQFKIRKKKLPSMSRDKSKRFNHTDAVKEDDNEDAKENNPKIAGKLLCLIN